jgi:hypothetical protein
MLQQHRASRSILGAGQHHRALAGRVAARNALTARTAASGGKAAPTSPQQSAGASYSSDFHTKGVRSARKPNSSLRYRSPLMSV